MASCLSPPQTSDPPPAGLAPPSPAPPAAATPRWRQGGLPPSPSPPRSRQRHHLRLASLPQATPPTQHNLPKKWPSTSPPATVTTASKHTVAAAKVAFWTKHGPHRCHRTSPPHPKSHHPPSHPTVTSPPLVPPPVAPLSPLPSRACSLTPNNTGAAVVPLHSPPHRPPPLPLLGKERAVAVAVANVVVTAAALTAAPAQLPVSELQLRVRPSRTPRLYAPTNAPDAPGARAAARCTRRVPRALPL